MLKIVRILTCEFILIEQIYIYRHQMQVYLSDGQGGGTTRQFEEKFSIDAW